MNDESPKQASPSPEPTPGRFLETLCIFLAVFVGVLGLGLALAALMTDDAAWHPRAMRVVWGAAGGVVLLAMAVILWALGAVLSRTRQQRERIEARAESSPPLLPERSELADRLDELHALINGLVSAAETVQREPADVSAEELARRIQSAMARQGWDQARELLDQYEGLYGADQRAQALRNRLTEQRREAEGEHKATLIGRIEDFMSAGRFDEARKIGLQLQESFPDDPQVRRQMERIDRESQAYQQDQVQRLYRKVQGQAKQRHWQAALEAAEQLQRQYPQSPESQLVEIIMETLRDNARLQRVRELRDRIRDLISRRRYGEALELARQVVSDYPETAAARELSAQMGRLEARAQQEE